MWKDRLSGKRHHSVLERILGTMGVKVASFGIVIIGNTIGGDDGEVSRKKEGVGWGVGGGGEGRRGSLCILRHHVSPPEAEAPVDGHDFLPGVLLHR
jgi:hypothetical protein